MFRFFCIITFIFLWCGIAFCGPFSPDPHIITDEVGRALITNTDTALSVGGYVLVVISSLVVVGIVIRFIHMLGPKRSVQTKHIFHYNGRWQDFPRIRKN